MVVKRQIPRFLSLGVGENQAKLRKGKALKPHSSSIVHSFYPLNVKLNKFKK